MTGPAKVAQIRSRISRSIFFRNTELSRILIRVHGTSQAQAETITELLSKKLKLNDVEMEEYDGTTWYSTEDEEGETSISAF